MQAGDQSLVIITKLNQRAASLVIINAVNHATNLSEQITVQTEDLLQGFLIQFLCLFPTKTLYDIHIAREVILTQSGAEHLLCCVAQLVCLVHNHKVAGLEQSAFLLFSHLLGGEIQIVVGDLKVDITTAIRLIHKAAVLALGKELTLTAASFHTELCFQGRAHIDGVQVECFFCQFCAFHCIKQFAVLIFVHLKVLHKIFISSAAEVMLLTLAKHTSEWLID